MKTLGMLILGLITVVVLNIQQVSAGNCIEVTSNGVDYSGTVSTAIDGLTCKPWSAQSKYTSFPADGGIANAQNYCRNPSGSDVRPWCYTASGWNYCYVQYCPHTCIEVTGKGTEYTGTVSTTITGATCNPWNAQTKYTDFYTDGGVDNAKNYCRNPAGSDVRPWCYTGSTWDYCYVPYCQHPCIEVTSKGTEYTGTVATANSGATCNPWTAQTKYTDFYTDGGVANAKNYCRNPAGSDSRPWCYTGSTWDYCNAYCKHDCLLTTQGLEYTGTTSQTTDGHTCINWTLQSRKTNFYTDGTITNAKNYCRNPDSDTQPWCYTDTSLNWQYCSIPMCGSTTPAPAPAPASVFTLVVDDVITALYANGVQISGMVSTNQVNVGTYNIPGTTTQIAIQGRNNPGKCGIIGSDTSGKLSTGSTWRCSNTLVAGWSNTNFDDSSWAQASAYSRTGSDYAWLPNTLGSLTIQASAQFIWTANCQPNQDIYCRSQ